jgi:hypothetical protein
MRGISAACRPQHHLLGHIGAKRLGQHHTAIGLLMIFENRYKGPAHGDT